MRRSTRVLLGAWLLSLLAVASASADPITWDFDGTVVATFGEWIPILPLGSPVEFQVTWDSSTPSDSFCPPGSGLFPAIRGAQFTVANRTYTTSGAGAIEWNAPDGNCGDINTGLLEFDIFGWSGPVGSPKVVQVLLDPFPVNQAAGPDLATMLEDVQGALDTFVQDPLQFGGSNSGSFVWEGTLEPVPEPTTLALLATGIVAAAGFGRRRTRRGPPASLRGARRFSH